MEGAIAGGGAEGGDGADGQADVEFAAAEAFFVEGECDAAVEEEGGTGVVPVPDTDEGCGGGVHAVAAVRREQRPRTR